MIVPTLALLVALQTPPNVCSEYQKRAAALATPRVEPGSEGEEQVVAEKASWYGGKLTYAFARSTGERPACSAQFVSLDHAGFTFDRRSDLAFESLEAVFDVKVASDFAHARLVAKTLEPNQPREKPMLWYLGKIYGYATLTGSNGIIVMSPADFKAELKRAQVAASHIH